MLANDPPVVCPKKASNDSYAHQLQLTEYNINNKAIIGLKLTMAHVFRSVFETPLFLFFNKIR
jgi:hypothetical protein